MRHLIPLALTLSLATVAQADDDHRPGHGPRTQPVEVVAPVTVEVQDPLPVEVQEPLQVEVTNPPEAFPDVLQVEVVGGQSNTVYVGRLVDGFVGFAPPHDGDFRSFPAGYEDVPYGNRIDLYCAYSFPGSRQCENNWGSFMDYFPDPASAFDAWDSWPDEGAWVDSGNVDCDNWGSNDASLFGMAAIRAPHILGYMHFTPYPNDQSCAVSRPVACCGDVRVPVPPPPNAD